MRDPIIITGVPRSGKTMISGILNICNVFCGDVNKQFENTQIENYLSDFLFTHGIDKYGKKGLTYIRPWSEPFFELQHFLQQTMKRQGYVDGPWFIKSSQIAIMWPLITQIFPNTKFVVVRRRTGDIVTSCLKTAYMNAYSSRQGWLGMCRSYLDMFVEMTEKHQNHRIIWPHRMSYGDYRQIYEMLEWLGLDWKTEILEWVDPKFLKVRLRNK